MISLNGRVRFPGFVFGLVFSFHPTLFRFHAGGRIAGDREPTFSYVRMDQVEHIDMRSEIGESGLVSYPLA